MTLVTSSDMLCSFDRKWLIFWSFSRMHAVHVGCETLRIEIEDLYILYWLCCGRWVMKRVNLIDFYHSRLHPEQSSCSCYNKHPVPDQWSHSEPPKRPCKYNTAERKSTYQFAFVAFKKSLLSFSTFFSSQISISPWRCIVYTYNIAQIDKFHPGNLATDEGI